MSSTTPPPNRQAAQPSGPVVDLGRAGAGLPIKTPVTAILEASKPIAFNINFARITGDAKAALFLSQLVYWTRRGADVLDNDGWVFKTRESWESELGLSKHEQATARSTLIGLGLIEEARTGAPARNCYRVMPNVLGAHLAQLVRTEPVQWSLLDIRSDSQHIRNLLGRQFAFYRVLMQITATCTSAIYLSKALAIQRRFADRQSQPTSSSAETAQLPWDAQWFRMAVDSTQAETGLSPAQQRDAKHKLCQLGLMHEAMMTHPRKQIYLRIDMQMLNQLLNNLTNKSACQNRPTENEPGSDQSGAFGISGKRIGPIHLPTLPKPDQAAPDPEPSGDPPDPLDLAACQNRSTENEPGSDQSEDCGISGKCMDPMHLPTLPQPVQAENGFASSSDPPDPFDSFACQNRPTRVPESDILVGRFSQGRWPLLARPMAGFSTPSGPVLAGLHAHASRVRQDYKEDYKETTTTLQPSSIATAENAIAAKLPPKEREELRGERIDRTGPPGDAVVVVASSEPSESLNQGQWIWPDIMTDTERQQGSRILGLLAKTGQLDDAQNILDELAGSIAIAGKVRYPVAYLRKLVTEHQATPGGLVFEKAHDVRTRRERLLRNALVQQQALQGQQHQGHVPASGPVVLSDAAKEGLAKAREMLAALKHTKGSS